MSIPWTQVVVQLQGNQNKSLPVSNATKNDKAGVPTETLAKCKLKSKKRNTNYYYPHIIIENAQQKNPLQIFLYFFIKKKRKQIKN